MNKNIDRIDDNNFSEYAKKLFHRSLKNIYCANNIIVYKYNGPAITNESIKSLVHLMVLMFKSDESILEDAKNGKFYDSYSGKRENCPPGFDDRWHNQYFFEMPNNYVISLGYFINSDVLYFINCNYLRDDISYRENSAKNLDEDSSVIEGLILSTWHYFIKEYDVHGDYHFYGKCIIDNDDTLKDFAKSILINVVDKDEDVVNWAVNDTLTDILPKTDIDYCRLLYRYRAELGDILYYAENNGYDINSMQLSFFDEKVAKEFFNKIVLIYCMALRFDSDNI